MILKIMLMLTDDLLTDTEWRGCNLEASISSLCQSQRELTGTDQASSRRDWHTERENQGQTPFMIVRLK